MDTFVVRIADSSGGRLRGVVERVSDRSTSAFCDADELIALLHQRDSTSHSIGLDEASP
jgi:hypothetical protein